MSSSNYKKKLLINFNEIKKEKTKLKTIKYINSNLIHFWTRTHKNNTQEYNHIFKHQAQEHQAQTRTKHKKHKLKFKH